MFGLLSLSTMATRSTAFVAYELVVTVADGMGGLTGPYTIETVITSSIVCRLATTGSYDDNGPEVSCVTSR